MAVRASFQQLHALLVLGLMATLVPMVSANCTNFTYAPNEFSSEGAYSTTARTKKVSVLVNCTGSALGSQPPSGVTNRCNATTCALFTPAYYYIETGSSLNISTPDNATYDALMLLIQDQFDQDPRLIDWNRTNAYSLGASPYGYCINEGMTQYISFTPFHLCTEGVLSGCSGAGPSDGTAILACGSKLLNPTLVDGQFTYVTTGSDGNAEFNALPPNATIPENRASPTGTQAPGSGANTVRGSYIVACIVAAAASVILL